MKRFGSVRAVEDVSFSVAPGEFLTLLGPSGSGKTTILRLLGGFEYPDAGRIVLDGRVVNMVPPYRRNIGVVFQSYTLFPHMTVRDNIAFPLRMRKVGREEQRRRIGETLELVGLAGYEARYPAQLSGGQQQRVALARATVFRPAVLLMDEPLGALDKQMRERMQREIRALQRQVGITTVYVTHDQSESLTMSDKIAVVHQGRIEQLGLPRELYERPATEFVARFVGDSNFLEGRVIGREGSTGVLALPSGTPVRFPWRGGCPERGLLMVRPEKLRLEGPPFARGDGLNRLEGRVQEVTYVGEVTMYLVDSAGQQLVVKQPNRAEVRTFRPGDYIIVAWSSSDCALLP